jgi:hypothetical protein
VLGVDEERKLYLKASIFSGVGFARHVWIFYTFKNVGEFNKSDKIITGVGVFRYFRYLDFAREGKDKLSVIRSVEEYFRETREQDVIELSKYYGSGPAKKAPNYKLMYYFASLRHDLRSKHSVFMEFLYFFFHKMPIFICKLIGKEEGKELSIQILENYFLNNVCYFCLHCWRSEQIVWTEVFWWNTILEIGYINFFHQILGSKAFLILEKKAYTKFSKYIKT